MTISFATDGLLAAMIAFPSLAVIAVALSLHKAPRGYTYSIRQNSATCMSKEIEGEAQVNDLPFPQGHWVFTGHLRLGLAARSPANR